MPAGTWVSPAIVATSNDLFCAVYAETSLGAAPAYEPIARIHAIDDAPQAGSAGLVTWGSTAAFDDFEMYSVE